MEIDIEEIIKYQIAGKIIATVPEAERKIILESSLVKTLHNVLRPWNIEKAISTDVEKYMVEYLKQDEVQQRIKAATEKATDELMAGVISVIISKSQDAIKSNYENFILKKKSTDIEKKETIDRSNNAVCQANV